MVKKPLSFYGQEKMVAWTGDMFLNLSTVGTLGWV